MYGIAFMFPLTWEIQGWANGDGGSRAEFATFEEAERWLLEEIIGVRGYDPCVVGVMPCN
jgi:hypothetical protein